MSGYRSGGGPAPELASVQAALAELLGALGLGAMAKQAGAERDPESQKLYARIILNRAPAERRPAMRERLERLGLV